MVWLYVLQSQSSERFYVGITERLDSRGAEHNAGQTESTSGRGPWKIVHVEEVPDRAAARKREIQVKSWKSHRSIAELIEKPG